MSATTTYFVFETRCRLCRRMVQVKAPVDSPPAVFVCASCGTETRSKVRPVKGGG
jgi:rRNA maturation endonuclease Nob1